VKKPLCIVVDRSQYGGVLVHRLGFPSKRVNEVVWCIYISGTIGLQSTFRVLLLTCWTSHLVVLDSPAFMLYVVGKHVCIYIPRSLLVTGDRCGAVCSYLTYH
jgi:hypothetical protein